MELTDSSGHDKGISPRIANLNCYMMERGAGVSRATACAVAFVAVFLFAFP
jgi:hypothetical protein